MGIFSGFFSTLRPVFCTEKLSWGGDFRGKSGSLGGLGREDGHQNDTCIRESDLPCRCNGNKQSRLQSLCRFLQYFIPKRL